jgi:hypothetical protein
MPQRDAVRGMAGSFEGRSAIASYASIAALCELGVDKTEFIAHYYGCQGPNIQNRQAEDHRPVPAL